MNTKLEAMSGPEIVKAFNTMAPQVNWKPVKKFRSLEAARQRLSKLQEEIAKNGGSSEPKKKSSSKSEKEAGKRIVILKAESNRGRGATEVRWLELMKLETKTVKAFLDLMERKGRDRGKAMGDLLWWQNHGRIKFE